MGWVTFSKCIFTTFYKQGLKLDSMLSGVLIPLSEFLQILTMFFMKEIWGWKRDCNSIFNSHSETKKGWCVLPVIFFVTSPEFCPECLQSCYSSIGHLFGYPRSVLVWREVVFSVEMGTNGFLLFQIGITLQPVALYKNVYASVVEDMILKVGACWQQRAKLCLQGLKHWGCQLWAGWSGSQAILGKGQGQWNGTEIISVKIFSSYWGLLCFSFWFLNELNHRSSEC